MTPFYSAVDIKVVKAKLPDNSPQLNYSLSIPKRSVVPVWADLCASRQAHSFRGVGRHGAFQECAAHLSQTAVKLWEGRRAGWDGMVASTHQPTSAGQQAGSLCTQSQLKLGSLGEGGAGVTSGSAGIVPCQPLITFFFGGGGEVWHHSDNPTSILFNRSLVEVSISCHLFLYKAIKEDFFHYSWPMCLVGLSTCLAMLLVLHRNKIHKTIPRTNYDL